MRLGILRLVLLAGLAVLGVRAALSPAQALTTTQWLLTPLSGAAEHDVAASVIWHGRLMTAAWAVLAPASVLVARYLKITPRQSWPARLDNPFWFLTHRRLGYGVALLTVAGVAIMLAARGQWAPTRSLHTSLGWSLCLLAVFQVVASLARGTHGGPVNPFTRQPRPPEQWPGDHFSMTRRRILFEYTHKTIGYLAILIAVVTIAAGLRAADAPLWMLLAIAAWWLLCAALFVTLQRKVGCIDTYQAIWGLDRSLPGYRRPPIGLGIMRLSEGEAGQAPWQRGKPKGDRR